VANETCKMIDVLKQNEDILSKQYDKILNDINVSLDSSKYEDNYTQIIQRLIMVKVNHW